MEPNYRPGDMANGYILGSDMSWHPMSEHSETQGRPTRSENFDGGHNIARDESTSLSSPSDSAGDGFDQGLVRDSASDLISGRHALLIAGVAAAVVLLVGAVVLLARGGSGSPDEVRSWVQRNQDSVSLGVLCYASSTSVGQAQSTWEDFLWVNPEFREQFPGVTAQEFYRAIAPLCY